MLLPRKRNSFFLLGALVVFQLAFLVNTVTSRSYTLYHDVKGDGSSYTKRSTISLSFEEQSAESSDNKSDLISTIDNIDECFGEWIDELVKSGLYYRLKLVDDRTGSSVITSVKACSLRRARLRERFELSLDPLGDLLSFSYEPITSPLAPSCEDLIPLSKILSTKSKDEIKEFFKPKSQVTLDYALNAATVPLVLPQSRPPPGLLFFQSARPGLSEDGKGGENPAEQKSFLMKYWYIILPLVLVSLLGGGVEEPPPAGTSGGDNAGQRGAATNANIAGAASAAVASGGAPRARRGKRD